MDVNEAIGSFENEVNVQTENNFDYTVGAVVVQLPAVQCVAGSIPATLCVIHKLLFCLC